MVIIQVLKIQRLKKGVSKNHNESLDIFHKYFEHSKNIEKATSETTIKPLISYDSFTN